MLHNLSFNCSKCAVLHFWCNNKSTAQYFLNNNNIESTELIKDLGIMISTDLSWSAHCNMVVSRDYKQLGLIRRSFTTNCTLTKKQLYISLVRSQLMYCSQISRGPSLAKSSTIFGIWALYSMIFHIPAYFRLYFKYSRYSCIFHISIGFLNIPLHPIHVLFI